MHACKSKANEMWQACMLTKIQVGFIKTENMLISKTLGLKKDTQEKLTSLEIL